MSHSEVPGPARDTFDTEPRPTDDMTQWFLPSPKRSASERRGLHAWHPYYAGYSERFVTDILKELEILPRHVVLDPMNGSGTTTMVAQKCSYLSIGVELNPAMAVIARAKDSIFSDERQLLRAGDVVARRATSREDVEWPDEYTAKWFPPAVFADLKRLDAEVNSLDEPPLLPLDPRFLDIVVAAYTETGGRIRDLLRAALLIAARRVSTAEHSKNPRLSHRRHRGKSPRRRRPPPGH